MDSLAPYVVITDIGSTTTKAILLDRRQGTSSIVAFSHSPTTVEKPVSDVRYGICRAIQALENQSGIQLRDKNSVEPDLSLSPEVTYLTTSSAGGGLQILVIGLTLFDSASSARRAAYGAGGVILDTFAIDDKRQAMQQMMAMRNLHPDMILLCGGTDGGAVSGVLRLAEIVRIAAPEPKFASAGRIPAIYAGNRDAAPLIESLISDDFDLHILPNLRPEMDHENLQPTQDMIQQLFMENVMEHAPGYTYLKPLVSTNIIPTPAGVQKALSIATGKQSRNIFACDIGGATTDIFSYVNVHFHRTVSANLGMSYSALNVLRESGINSVIRWLPDHINEDMLRNYVANRTLDPTSNPRSENDFRIEHAIAREALSMALIQHYQMHYNTTKIGFLDKLRKSDNDRFEVIFEYAREERKYCFSPSDVDVLIGAGGVFAHAQKPEQTIMILIDAYQPKGITEIWMDRHFISPHLGVLSAVDPSGAEHLMANACLEKLAVHISPLFSTKQQKAVLRMTIDPDGEPRVMEIMPDEFYYLNAGTQQINLEALNGAMLGKETLSSNLTTDLPLIIDTRIKPYAHRDKVEQQIQLYEGDHPLAPTITNVIDEYDLHPSEWIREIKLPYKGDVNVSAGDQVEPDDVVALNRFNPPRLYILDALLSLKLKPAVIARSLQVKVGDVLDFNAAYAQVPDEVALPSNLRHARKQISPVHGKVEFVNAQSGIVVLSEIQDYSAKPATIDLGERLGVPPKLAARYLTKNVGDFVYRNELIAKRLERYKDSNRPALVMAPITGTITDLDRQTGRLTITYLHKPMEFKAHVRGIVTAVQPEEGLIIRYSGRRLTARIGFGQVSHGEIAVIRSPKELTDADLKDKVLVLTFAPDTGFLRSLAGSGATGVIIYMILAGQLVSYLGFEPGVINTGFESIPLTLLILGGFGEQAMPPRMIDLFKTGENCLIDPHTRIRAGVVRPFICLT